MDVKSFSIFLGILLGAINAFLGWILIRRSTGQKNTMKWMQVLLGSMGIRMLLILSAFAICLFTLTIDRKPFAISFIASVFMGLTIDVYWLFKKINE